MFSINWMLHLL